MVDNSHVLMLLLLLLGTAGCNPSGEPESTAGDQPPHAPAHVSPVVDASAGQLLGASRGDEWLTAEEALPHVSSGQEYRLYGLTDSAGTRTAGGLQSPGETCTNPSVSFEDLPSGASDLIGVAGSWDVLPRTPSLEDTTLDMYRNRVASQLSEHDIEAANPPLDQVLRVDLEGDGVEEVLLVSNRLRGAETIAMAGDYGMVLLRKPIGNRVRQLALEAAYYAKECRARCAPLRYRITNVLDLNGDGVQEVVIGFESSRGRGKRVYAVNGWKLRVVMSWQCGE